MKQLSKITRKLTLLVLSLCFVSLAQSSSIEDSNWNRLLEANVNQAGWVDYQSIRSEWNESLKGYIKELGATDIDDLTTNSARKAFWINAYNAVTIQTLIDEGLPEEVPHARFFGKNIFKQENYRIAGKVRSLDEIEHEILRKRYSDPRIHAALVCGASSCPRLRPEAYTAEKLNEQLDEEVRIWLRKGLDKKGNRKNYLDRDEALFHASEIFKWFNEDFKGGGKAGVLKFIAQYLPEEDRNFIKKHEVDIEYLDYDWSLNNRE